MQRRNAPPSQALACEETDFDLRLIQPAAVNRSVVDCEPIPDFAAEIFAVQVHQGLPTVSIQIIDDKMNGRGGGIMYGQVEQHLSKLVGGPVRRRPREMLPGLRFYRAERVGCSTPFVFAIAFGNLAGCGRLWWPHISMECDRFLIQTHHWLPRIVGAFVNLQNFLHLADVLGGQLRDTPHFFPATA